MLDLILKQHTEQQQNFKLTSNRKQYKQTQEILVKLHTGNMGNLATQWQYDQ